jgi:predicted exporter
VTSAARNLLLLAWIAVAVLLAVYVQEQLTIGSDLRLFMPAPSTPAQRLLLEEVGQGPVSRLLLVGLTEATPEALAESSIALAERLRSDPGIHFVFNGKADMDSLPEAMLPYRYLLSPTLDEAQFDAPFLARQLQARLRDLASPAANLLESWVTRDPTCELLNLIQAWEQPTEPEQLYDVWFNRRGDTALLLVQTAAAGFDPDSQQAAIQALRKHFADTRTGPAVQLAVTGPGAFSALIKERAQREAQLIGAVDTITILALLIFAYRSLRSVLLAALPIASAGIAGLAAVSALFDEVHGITLAFGFTLIGVAQDYPIHLLSHQHRGASALESARSLWPTLATGVASTCIAYLAFLFSGVTGLAQLACFTVSGLAVAGLTTRYLLPRLLPASGRDHGTSALVGRVWEAIARLPAPGWLGLGVTLAALSALLFAPGPLWENNLGSMTPIPRALLEQDRDLRVALGAPDIRYLLVIEGNEADGVLARSDELAGRLRELVNRGALAGFDYAARYLPTRAIQQRRQLALPAPATLRAALATAQATTPFKTGVFEPFLADVERARHLPPLTPAALAATPLGPRIDSLLSERDGRWLGLITLTGVLDAEALAALAHESGNDVTLLDLKEASEQLVAGQRSRILASLAIAAGLLVAIVLLALRSVSRARRVLAPMALTTLLTLGVLHGAGVALSLFHLIALVLAAGLGLDYALFFERARGDQSEQRRTLHAVIVCSLSTLIVFAVMALSTLPVLRSIGITVTLGVIGNFVLSLLLTRPPPSAHRAGP